MMALTACTSARFGVPVQNMRQVGDINSMDLYEAFVVPVDNKGGYVCEEIVLPGMYDHSELLTDTVGKKVSILATVYFDDNGRLRKYIQRWSDGGSLNNVTYFDERGYIVYSLYANGSDDYGKVYNRNSKIRLEHTYTESQLYNDFLSTVRMSAFELADAYKFDLLMPDCCRLVNFSHIEKGDWAFVQSRHVYTAPNKSAVEDSVQIGFGNEVYIDSIAGRWCTIKTPAIDTLTRYVPINCIEISRFR